MVSPIVGCVEGNADQRKTVARSGTSETTPSFFSKARFYPNCSVIGANQLIMIYHEPFIRFTAKGNRSLIRSKNTGEQLILHCFTAYDGEFISGRIMLLVIKSVRIGKMSVLIVMVAGKDNLDVSGMVLRDRETLATDGAIVVGVVVDFRTKKIIGGPDVQSRGVIYLKDADYIVKEIGNIMERTIEDAVYERRYDNLQVRSEVREKISRYVAKETGKRPMILPAIVEIVV